MLGNQAAWQLYWVLVGTVVLISAVSVANLYVQGGMQLRHAAWFTLLLAVYGFFFNQIVPLTLTSGRAVRPEITPRQK